MRAHEGKKTVAEHQIKTPQIHQCQIAPVIHMDIRIQIIGQNVKFQYRRVKDGCQTRLEKRADQNPQHAEDQIHGMRLS